MPQDGHQGPAGQYEPPGSTGSRGWCGYRGTRGPQGTQGTQGTRGPQGTQGTPGTPGVRSVRGGRGPAGSGAGAVAGTPRPDRAALVFAVLRSWAAGIIVLTVASALLGGALFERFGTVERMESFGWRVVLLYVPVAVQSALSALVAARVHRMPFRHHLGQHLLATLAVPLAAHLYGLARHWTVLAPEGVALSSLAVAVGCLAASVVDVMRGRQGAG